MSGTPGRPHRGRRDNGLDATEFVPLADVDPRIGEHLLDVLGIVGIAAYLAPSADLNPVVRSTSLPARPTDRLWVDRDRLDEARGLLEAVQEDAVQNDEAGARSSSSTLPLEVDVDTEWERIIAGYDATAAPERPRRRAVSEPPDNTSAGDVGPADAPALSEPTADPLPVRTPGTADQPVRPDPTPTDPTRSDPAAADATLSEPTRVDPAPADPEPEPPSSGVEPTAGPPTESRPAAPSSAPPGAGLLRPTGRDRLIGTDAPPTDFPVDDEEGYEPPPPPPLPRLSAPVIGALLAIAAGLVLLFRSDTLGLSESVRLLLALCGILGGAGALVWRLRDDWTDDDPDDGAVV
ncbi:DUF308 domain-containing protein [Cryptosporangium minutisporangium]|uniref:DUF308 domain-containing protein n=1 Tax=Cryptosporangium minutisporangium TaxID=113569 RepID=A0ABP6TBJ9_9ACTN